jgi:hypothetical protein
MERINKMNLHRGTIFQRGISRSSAMPCPPPMQAEAMP